MRSSESVYHSRLDHLRFLAALMILLWHSLHYGWKVPAATVPDFFLTSLWEEGHTGVALFVTLSGFLFASLTDGKEIRYGAFVKSRILRIAPLFLFWTLVGFAASQLTPEKLVAAIFGFLDRSVQPSVGWTILVEFQLYLLFPFLLAFTRRYGLKYLAGVLVLTAFVRAAAWLFSGSSSYVGYFTVFGRVDQFVLGILAFHASRRFDRVLGNPLVFIAGFLGLSLLYHLFNQKGGLYGAAPTRWIYMPVLEGLGHGFLIASYLLLRIPLPGVFDRFVAWLGTLSYSFYLNHTYVMDACFNVANRFNLRLERMEDFSFFTLCVILPLLVACSALTYYMIEYPFLALRRAYTSPQSTSQLSPIRTASGNASTVVAAKAASPHQASPAP